MAFKIDGRLVYVRTGTKTQTLRICGPENRRESYEDEWRFEPPLCGQDEIEKKIRLDDVRSLERLRAWLKKHKATCESDRQATPHNPPRTTSSDAKSIVNSNSGNLQSRIDALVARRFRDFGLAPRGKTYKTRDHFTKFCQLITTNEKNAVCFVTCLLTDIFMKLRLDAESASPGPGNRGVLRQELGLSKDRIQEVRQGRLLEEMLERLIAELMGREDAKADWFNQFNVVGGFFDRSPLYLDLVRRPKSNPTSLDFIELKKWPAADHPFAAALQVFTYSSLAIILSAMGREPPKQQWPAIEAIHMAIAAPVAWYEEYGRDGNAEAVLMCFERAVASLPACLWEPFPVRMSFSGTGLKLELDESDFVSIFAGTPDRDYGSVGQAIASVDRKRLTDCFSQAFSPLMSEKHGND